MSQIRPTQILPAKRKQQNPNVSLPRDLNETTIGEVIPVQERSSAVVDNLADASVATNIETSESTYMSPDTATQIENLAPQTPAILEVRSQTVGFQPDGTAKIDLVLVVQDIDGAVEYDIRVAKNAGNV